MDTTKSAHEHYEQGRTLRQKKMYDQALEALHHVTHHPAYAGQAQIQVGLCLRAMGRHDEAVTALREALNCSSLSQEEYTHVLYLLGQYLESLGRSAEAIEAFNWVRQEDPGFRDVETKIKKLCGAGTQTVDLLQLGRSFIGKFARSAGSIRTRPSSESGS
ncbi:MAG TPA: tetratricopeptide repeat protein [Nitrospiraceae bacterium]|nr:tetratricopeptide repeat protein [Nitrospiraceae bacterium]